MLSLTLALALALAGCDGGDETDGGTSMGDGDTPGRDGGTPPTGEASLAFVPTWDGAQAQFRGLNWESTLDLNIFQPATEDVRDTRVVIMLCPSGDTTCESPVLIREIREDETDGDPIQDSFGPEITATELPAGDYELMIFADTGVSRSRGFGWEDAFETDETAWGGVVSELDVMLSEEEVEPGFTPPPATMAITLTDGETTDLGTLTLQHVHERDIGPGPNTETGTMAVAIADGLRLIDLSTNELVEAAPGFPTWEMVDSGGSTVGGTVCGMVDGPDDTVFLLYTGGGSGAGFAIQFDVGDPGQLHGGNRITFPGDGIPCRGRYHSGHLYVTNASASRLPTSAAAAEENLWVADPSVLTSGDVAATLLDRTDDGILQHGVDDFAAVGSTLYLSMNGENTNGGLPSECVSNFCVFEATIGSDGLPTLDSGGGYEYIVGPEIGEGYPTSSGNVSCIYPSAWTAIETADFHDGRTLLFVGGCLEVAVFDTADGSELDLGAAPGNQGLDGTPYGHVFHAFALSPDGSILWALPQIKSPYPMYFQPGLEDRRVSFNRYMAFPIDLSSGDAPALHPDYVGEDIDGYEGRPDGAISDYETPALDPGVDINLAYETRYRMRFMPSSTGFQPAAIPNGPNFEVTSQSLWVRGAGNAEAGASGLGKSGNLAVYDLEARRMILWSYDESPFYRFWHGGADPEPTMGYDLTPESDAPIATFGLRYVP
ncbi:MAG TPA: hypothetical protein RMH99_02565 [Sandaracinaceae bacterium LLY-WYZ-13_1]|nr:hypothetical protein [Sandaracinaceae bacterium LLY-WYZ-13_1]